jgi:hypothetical protein
MLTECVYDYQIILRVNSDYFLKPHIFVTGLQNTFTGAITDFAKNI